MRAVMALASLEASAGNKQKALDAISTGELFAPGYMPLQAFRKKIEAGEKPPVGVTSATQGASAVLFSVGAALNQSLTNAPDREGAQDIVAFYLVTAFSLDQNASDAAILLGGLAENNNHPEQAIEWYRKVPLTSPLRRTADLQLGLNLATTGKVDDAKRHLQSAIAADPTDVRGYISYGSLLSDNKDYQEMAKNYDKAVDVLGPFPDRADWSVFFQRGIAYERLKRWPEAEPNFKKALELYPDQPQVLNYLGYSWVDMNIHLDEGLAMIRKAVDLRPDDGYIVDSLGWAYYRLGRYDDAVSELEHAVELKSADATINDHLGDAYWRAGRKLEAIFQWRIALDMKGDDLDRDLVKKKIREGLPPAEIHAEVKQSTPVAVDKVAQNQPATADDSTTKPAATDDGKTAKPANDQQPSTSAAQTSHTVVKGDSLWNIAKGLLGNGQRFIEIIHLNPELKRHPDIIRPGQMLKLPDGKM
jgi:tetratricopeptide (TPR) repeat protein